MRDRDRAFLGMLGLCRRARRLVSGTEMTCLEMAKCRKPALVIVSLLVSPATQKKITDKCAHYNIPCLAVDIDGETLAAAIGNGNVTAAVAITDNGFAERLQTLYEESRRADSHTH